MNNVSDNADDVFYRYVADFPPDYLRIFFNIILPFFLLLLLVHLTVSAFKKIMEIFSMHLTQIPKPICVENLDLKGIKTMLHNECKLMSERETKKCKHEVTNL